MKLLITILLATLLASASANRVIEAEDFIRGLFQGSFGEVGHEVVECIQDGGEIFKDIIIIAEDFEKAATKWKKDPLVDAFKHISHILTLLPEEVKDCKGVAALVVDLEKLAVEFANPIGLVIHLGGKMVWHGRSIYKDVRKATDDFKIPDYEAAGYDIGDIIRIIFLNGMMKSPFTDVTSFVTEFYTAAFALDLDLITCEDDLAASIEKISEGIDLIFNGTSYEDSQLAAYKIVYGAKTLIEDVEKCEEAWPIFELGIQKFSPLIDNYIYLAVAIPAAFLVNPITFVKDLKNVKNSVDHYPFDFKLGGYSSGDLIKIVLRQME